MVSLGRVVAPLLAAALMTMTGAAVRAQETPAPAPVETPATQAQTAPTEAPAAATPAPAAPAIDLAPTPPATPASPDADASPAPLAAPDMPGASATDITPPVAEPAPAVAAEGLPHDLSPWGMFMAADMVVKSVMVGLALASLVTWTVWLAKSFEIFGARRRMRAARALLNDCADLGAARQVFAGQRGVVPLMVRATHEESRASAAALSHSGGDGLKERVGSHLSRIEAEAGRRMTRGTSIIATIGSVAPFVGLFGTVWGIMNSFIGISESQTTNLAVVAPGIAEALLATAMGLVAAIPAVVIYNHLARTITGYRQQLGDISANLERMVSRDLDHGRLRGFDLAAE
jgi:biopolymer transport protein ExbB